MSVDIALRAVGTLACLYGVGLFVTVMSLSALNAVSFNAGPMCGMDGCVAVAYEERLERPMHGIPVRVRLAEATRRTQKI
jgi:hypothetical protein